MSVEGDPCQPHAQLSLTTPHPNEPSVEVRACRNQVCVRVRASRLLRDVNLCNWILCFDWKSYKLSSWYVCVTIILTQLLFAKQVIIVVSLTLRLWRVFV